MKYVIALILYFIGGVLYAWYWNHERKEERIACIRDEMEKSDDPSQFNEELIPITIAITDIVAVTTWPICVFLDIFKYKVLTR